MKLSLYDYILRSGSAGYTDDELKQAFKLSADTIRHRRSALLRSGQIVSCHFLRRNKSGRRAAVWMTSKVANKLKCFLKG